MAPAPWPASRTFVPPMLATLADAPLESTSLVYEPKYDGVRAIVQIRPGRPPAVTLWSRAGHDKTRQFPEVAAGLAAWAGRLRAPIVLDGEIVAVDDRGTPLGFQHLQSRIHRSDARRDASERAVFVAFDLLRAGDEDLRPRPLRDRRARLTRLFAHRSEPHVRLSEQVTADARALHARAVENGWEGLIAKRADAPYLSGVRSPDWRKLKLVRRVSAVIGGWTAPRGLRSGFGALIVGQYDDHGRLMHIGQVGTGFDQAEITRLSTRLAALAAPACPFADRPKTRERAHWVKPVLVAEIAFMEWTHDRRLRHPRYLGLRDDTPAARVVRDNDVPAPGAHEAAPPATAAARRGQGARAGRRLPAPEAQARGTSAQDQVAPVAVTPVLDALTRLERSGDDGTIDLPGGTRLAVSNLRKVLWPETGGTKGDLLRHYARVAPYLLPALADRPLVMKRYPNGIDAKPFYQHRAPDHVPPGVRVEQVAAADGRRAHLVGGALATLLYTAQLAAISQDPWGSRVGSESTADYVAFDLDPPDAESWDRVREVALTLKEELDRIGASTFPKTSGSRGLHVYVPMPPDTPFDAAQLYAQIVATVVAARLPRLATVERAIAARRGRVYVDTLQNALGKTLASVYSARANAHAGVSAPLSWNEIENGALHPRDITMRTIAARLDRVGDLWAALPVAPPADLLAVTRYAAAPEANDTAARLEASARPSAPRTSAARTTRAARRRPGGA